MKVKTPGGVVKTHYRERKPRHARCARCGAVLKGVPREVPSKLSKMSRSRKKPSRPFAGTLCSRCMREEIKRRMNENA